MKNSWQILAIILRIQGGWTYFLKMHKKCKNVWATTTPPAQEFRLLLIRWQYSGYKTEYYELKCYGSLFKQSCHSEVNRQLLLHQKQRIYHRNYSTTSIHQVKSFWADLLRGRTKARILRRTSDKRIRRHASVACVTESKRRRWRATRVRSAKTPPGLMMIDR